MKPDNLVTCPNCRHQFSIETALTADLEKELDLRIRKELNDKYIQEKKKIEEGIRLKEEQLALEKKSWMEQFQKDQVESRKAMEEQVSERLKKENEDKIESLKNIAKEQSEKIAVLSKLEIEKLEMQAQISRMQENHNLETKKLLLEKELELKERLTKEAEQRSELVIAEYKKREEDSKKLIEEMRRKSEQGSMQLQGEVQELALEEMLRQTFPFDRITEVAKGVRGADMIQYVVNHQGQDCGSIVWESKRTKEFQPLWIEKFKTDFRQSGGDIGVLVTQSMPKDMAGFGLKEGVYICQYHEAKSLAIVLRTQMLRISEAISANENKGEKMQMLYTYLTGNEFRHQMEAITEGFMNMK